MALIDRRKIRLRNTIFFSEDNARDTRFHLRKRFANLNLCELCLAVRFISRLSISRAHIGHIVGLCARKKMGRIDARRIIAGVAQVKRPATFTDRNRAIRDLISYAMSEKKLGPNAETAISVLVCGCRPVSAG